MSYEAPAARLAEPDSWQVRDLRLSLSQLKANFDQVVRERDEAREVARDALEVVKVLARTFGAPELTEMKRQAPRKLEEWGVHDYGNFVLTTVSAMRQGLLAANRELKEQVEKVGDGSRESPPSRLDTLGAQLAQCREERDQARAALKEAEAQNAQLESRVKAAQGSEETLRGELAAAHEHLPELSAKAWDLPAEEEGVAEGGNGQRSRGPEIADEGLSENELHLLRMLAREGTCRRPEIETKLKSEHGVPPGGTMARLFARLEQEGLIEQARPKSEIGAGPPPALVWLSKKGAHRCRDILGLEPVEQEGARLRSRHKSMEHAYLNLVAGDVLREMGYQVDLFPEPIEVDGSSVEPDILATRDGRVIIVECERYTRKDKEHRARKWNGLVQASQRLGGSKALFVLTPSKEAKNAIISELSQWRGEWRETAKGTEVHVSSAHEVLVQGKGLWSYERQF